MCNELSKIAGVDGPLQQRHPASMAKTTITQITDDLDGSRDAEEVSFSFRGIDYTIDLSKKNQTAMEKALKPYLDAASKPAKRSSSTAAKRTGTKPKAAARKSSRSTTRQDLAAVRDWARANNIDVSDKGRISRNVMDQYAAAQS